MPGTFAFVHTDIQGSTALWERHGTAFAPILAEHNRIVAQAIAAAGGSAVRTEGDAFVAAFGDANGAILFAAEVQARLHAAPWPAGVGEVLVRVGACLASGDPAAAEARATRVARAAHGGQSLVTEDLRGAAKGRPPEVTFLDLGEVTPGIDTPPEHLWQIVHSSLVGRRFPPPRPAGTLRTNLPAEGNTFVGRETETAALMDLLPRPEGRLVTLTGPSGIGKTRLAVHVASSLAGRFPGGAWLADVSEGKSAADVASAVAAAFGVSLSGRDDPSRIVAEALASRPPLLLVLDGFEPVAAYASATLGVWTQRARAARFLVASRVLLQIAGEREVPVPPLAAPQKRQRDETGRRMASNPAEWESVRLFADRAAAGSPGWCLDASNAADVAQVCTELEGIPLAIEIAAAQVRESSPSRILRELRARAPGASAPGTEAVRAALSSTVDRLEPWEKSVFAQTCVFRGGFTLESAEAVIDLSDHPEAPPAMDGIQALRDRSLVRTWDTARGTRFGLFQAVREAAAALLVATGGRSAEVALRNRHARHYAGWGEEWRRRIYSRDPAEALERLGTEEDNLLAACDASAAGDPTLAVRALASLTEVLAMRGPMDVFVARGEPLFDDPRLPPDVAASFAPFLARSLWVLGRGDRAIEICIRGRERAVQAGSGVHEARILMKHAEFEDERARHREAMSLVERALELARSPEEPLLAAHAAAIRGILLLSANRHDEAIRDFSQAVACVRESGDWFHLAKFTSNLGAAHRSRGDREAALACYDEAERLFRAMDNRNDLGAVISNRGILHYERGDTAACARAFEESAAIHRESGNRAALAVIVGNLAALDAISGDLPRALARYAEAEEIWLSLGARARLATLSLDRGGVLMEMRRFEEALADLERSESGFDACGAASDVARCRIEMGECRRLQGRPEDCEKAVRAALNELATDGVDQWWARVVGLASLACAEEDLGRAEEARATARLGLEASARLGDRHAVTRRGERARADLKRISGL